MELRQGERLDDLQCNNLFIIQNENEYCFTSDAVALANFVKVSSYGSLVDLCSGSGVIGILANAKNKIKDVYLVELQEYYADMASRSIEYNNLSNVHSVCHSVQGVSDILGSGRFDAVVCNPPYKKTGTAKMLNEKESVTIARHEVAITLEEIILEANKLLKFGGDFYIVDKEERLTDIIVLLRKYKIEPKVLKILPSSKGANVVMLKGKKGGKSGITISL